jgi:hypothetical protein
LTTTLTGAVEHCGWAIDCWTVDVDKWWLAFDADLGQTRLEALD